MKEKSNSLRILIPIMLSFFVMGLVDLVGVSTNYVKNDFSLDNFSASIFPMMVFLWFAVFSIPTGLLMGRIGRKKTVSIAIFITIVALLIPYLDYNYYVLIIAFALLGIGNTMLQVSLNPLVASIVANNRLASTLTFGQFVKAMASFMGPVVTSFAAKQFGDWRLAFVAFAVMSLLTLAWINFTPINEEKENALSSFQNTLKLLKDRFILKLFLGILLIVGIDVCMNTYTPALFGQRLGMHVDDAALGSSLYFASRTIGAFLGAFLLMKFSPSSFLKTNMIAAIAAFLILMFTAQQWSLFAGVVLVGFTCANVFSIIFTVALQYKKGQTNEVSSLMVIGVAGGAIVTPIVGLVADKSGLAGGFGLLFLCSVYLFYLSFTLSKR
ncbi:MFS transporter [Dysgonomonas sp.]